MPDRLDAIAARLASGAYRKRSGPRNAADDIAWLIDHARKLTAERADIWDAGHSTGVDDADGAFASANPYRTPEE